MVASETLHLSPSFLHSVILTKDGDNGENQDGGVDRHTAPPRTTRTDRKTNDKEV